MKSYAIKYFWIVANTSKRSLVLLPDIKYHNFYILIMCFVFKFTKYEIVFY